MSFDYDVIIIGDGPAGISFFNRLKSSHKNVALITISSPAQKDDIYSRFSLIDCHPSNTWKFLNSAVDQIIKFEVPFFSSANKKFMSTEYFGLGGLSNRWGAGCAKLNATDLGVSEALLDKIASYYDEAEKEVGIYYHGQDLLDNYLGEFINSNTKLNTPNTITFPVQLTAYCKIGRTRQAFLQAEKGMREPCNNCGGCFIFCQNKTIYNAKYLLEANSQWVYESSKVVGLSKIDGGYRLKLAKNQGGELYLEAKHVILAAGTLGSTRLLSTLIKGLKTSIFRHSMVVRTVFFGMRREKRNNFPMGQYVVQTQINKDENAYTSLTHGASIPTSDIVNLLPIKNSLVYTLVNYFKKYLVVAMTFYSSEYSGYKIQLGRGQLSFLEINCLSKFNMANKMVMSRLKEIMRLNSLHTLSFFSLLLPRGSDIHYGGTIPIGPKREIGCDENCEIWGFPNLYVIDASWMPRIPEKPHTFTIIANAIRVADCVSARLRS